MNNFIKSKVTLHGQDWNFVHYVDENNNACFSSHLISSSNLKELTIIQLEELATTVIEDDKIRVLDNQVSLLKNRNFCNHEVSK